MCALDQGKSENQPQAAVDLAPLYLVAAVGFSCLIGWELTAVFAPSVPLLSWCSIEEGIKLRIASVLALVVTYVVFGLKADWVYEHRDRLLPLSSLLALAAVAESLVSTYVAALPFAVSAAVWVLFGFAQASAMSCWCVFFSIVPTKRTAHVIACGAALGTLLFVLVNATSLVWASLLQTALLIGGSMGAVAFLSRRIPRETVPRVDELRAAPALSATAAVSVACHGAVYGFMTVELCSMGYEAALVGGASGIGGILLVFVWNYLGARVNVDVGVVQRITLPFLVASVLLLPFCDGAARVACGCVANMALAHTSVFAWYSTSIDNYEFRLHPVRRYAMRQAPSWLGFFLGSVFAFVLVFALELEGMALCLAMALFSVVVVVSFSVYGGDESEMRARLDDLLDVAGKGVVEAVAQEEGEGEDPAPQALTLERRCAHVAERYALTPREGEVLILLARGRNAEYIAGALTVSPATVKSHIYHIYRKLGINSQQRLMDIVDEWG
ncbi:helix-turn-helix transcriptional regulator [Adlercreutzia sp. ZJ242]|uniref:helix-turn-helix transcriptional regulator n=1 Tax=Adlercreutzia sp. ZJ242 TaxID=2709409 RepID=UPI0013E9A5EC|nr:helix-turn-helix transcriptional regulator [Adlercreutzia sp. ZJ242]